jgi:hypothetical protein
MVDVARMLGHELGHISGEILDDDAEEEERADRYGAVAELVLKMLTGQKSLLAQRQSRSTSRVGKANRQAREVAKPQGVGRPSLRTAPTSVVQVRKRSPKG